MKIDPETAPKAHVSPDDHVVMCRTLEEASELPLDEPVFVEIGTHKCYGSRAIITILNQLGRRSRFLTFDIKWKVQWLYPREHWAKKCENLAARGPCRGEFHEMEGKRGAELVKAGSVAWVFVDGCHCRDCVEAELNIWAPMVCPGGWILLHDSDQRYETQDGDQRYHSKTEPRRCRVWTVSETNGELIRDFELVDDVPAIWDSHKKRADPYLFGGLRTYRKRGEP